MWDSDDHKPPFEFLRRYDLYDTLQSELVWHPLLSEKIMLLVGDCHAVSNTLHTLLEKALQSQATGRYLASMLCHPTHDFCEKDDVPSLAQICHCCHAGLPDEHANLCSPYRLVRLQANIPPAFINAPPSGYGDLLS